METQNLISQDPLPALLSSIRPEASSHTAKKSNSVRKISEEDRQQMVATNAYYRAQYRNFEPGYEEDDWFAAEIEINELLRKNIMQ